MKKSVLFLLVQLLSISSFAGPSRVIYFDGFPIVHMPIYSDIIAHYHIEKYLKANHPNTQFEVVHNMQWREVCKKLTNLSDQEKPDRLILIGHSYGSGSAMNVSRCLKDHPVDLVVSIDSIRQFFTDPDEIVPDNVRMNYNFYEQQDLLLRGIQENRRQDGRVDGSIQNIHKPQYFKISPHIQIVNDLVDENIFIKLIDQVLR